MTDNPHFLDEGLSRSSNHSYAYNRTTDDMFDPFGPVYYPDLDPAAVTPDAFNENGRQNAIDAATSAFDSCNPTARAQAAIADGNDRLAALRRQERRLSRAVRHTNPTLQVITAARMARLPLVLIVESGIAVLFLVVLLTISNVGVVSKYLEVSGADMFANDRLGACMFVVTAILSAIAVKAYEHYLRTDFGKICYRRAFFAIGLVSFLVWSIMAAIGFAPEIGSSSGWLLAAGNGRAIMIALMAAHLLIDASFGYIIYSVAMDIILSVRQRIEIANPHYNALVSSREAATREVAACQRLTGLAQAHLKSVAAGREVMRIRAERAFHTSVYLLNALETEGSAQGRLQFIDFIRQQARRTSAILIALATATALLFASPADARNLIMVLPVDYPGDKAQLIQLYADAVGDLAAGDRLLVYTARPVSRLATIAVPDDPRSDNRAWVKRKLAEQSAPVLRYLAELPGGTSGEPPGNLMPTQLLDELGRNVVPGLPGTHADVLLLGSMINFDPRDGRWTMTRRYYPADGFLSVPPTDSAFGVAGAESRLAGATLHWCWPEVPGEFVSVEHEQRVRRWWSVWARAQSARIGTISHDLAGCFKRFLTGKTDGQTDYQPVPNAKPEMLQAPAPAPIVLPPDTSRPGAYFLRDDVEISSTPPTATTGVALIGLKWSAACDVDLYARGDSASPWLFFGRVRTAEGFFSKDFVAGTGDKQLEYVEFTKTIALDKAEVAINLYEADLPLPPEGVIRVWFAGGVYEAPWKLEARTGNHGAMPISGPRWLRIDLQRIVGLSS